MIEEDALVVVHHEARECAIIICIEVFSFADLVLAKAFEGDGKICFGDLGHFDSWFLYSNCLSLMKSSVVYLSS